MNVELEVISLQM